MRIRELTWALVLGCIVSATAAQQQQQQQQPIPAETGLSAVYFNDVELRKVRRQVVDLNIDFVRTKEVWPPGGVNWDNWSARWTGQIVAPASEAYTFYTTSDDGVRLWVGGQNVVNDWASRKPPEKSGTIALEAGKRYDFILEYFNTTGGAQVKLEWSSPSTPRQVVPAGSFLKDRATSDNPPACRLLSPTEDLNAFVEGKPLPLRVEATDGEGDVAKVEFFVDDKKVAEDGSAPFEHPVEGLVDGKYTIKARAVDRAGNWTDSPTQLVHVYRHKPGPEEFIIGVWGQPIRNTEWWKEKLTIDFGFWADQGINTLIGYDRGPQNKDTAEQWMAAAKQHKLRAIRQFRNGWRIGATYAIDVVVQNKAAEYQCTQEHSASADTEPGAGPNWQNYWKASDIQHRFLTDGTVSLAEDGADPDLVAWGQPDEPDLNDTPLPAELVKIYGMMQRTNPQLPVYLNFAGPRLADSKRKGIYQDYMHAADWLGEDSYPWNNEKPLRVIAERADLLERYSAGKPHITFIECNWQRLTFRGKVYGRAPTAYEMRAQIWLAIIHGATGICYFPQRIGGGFRYALIPPDCRDPDNPVAPSGGEEFDLRAMMKTQNALLKQESDWLVKYTAGSVLTGLPEGLEGIERTFNGTGRKYILNTTDQPVTHDGHTYQKYELRIIR